MISRNVENLMKNKIFTIFSIFTVLILTGCQHLGLGSKTASSPAFGIISLDNATVAAAKQLSDAFIDEGDEQKIKIYRGMPDKAQYYIKGYFSVIVDESPDENMVLYVFDIVDKDGSRLHRIEGKYVLNRVLVPARDGFWASITKDGYDAIATETIRQIGIWVATNRGNL